MKILFLTDDFPPQSFGGAGIVASNLARFFQKKGQEVFVITITQDLSEEGWSFFDGLCIYKIFTKYDLRFRAFVSLYNPEVVWKARQLIKEIAPDVVHAHNIHAYISYATLLYAKKYAKRVFLTAHDAMSFAYGKIIEGSQPESPFSQLFENKFRYNPLRNILIRWILRKTDKIFSVSDSLKYALLKNGIVNVETIHNGIDVTGWGKKNNNNLFKEKYQLSNKKVILFGGRLSKAKGSEVVLHAMALVLKSAPDAVLLVVGQKNKESESMIRKAGELGIEKHILFTGWIDSSDMSYVYASAKVVVVASLYLDPFPTINLEAMASRLPVVGTCFGGTPEIVSDGMTGYIVDPNDIENLAKKVVILLNDDKLNVQFGERGYSRVSEKFSLEKQGGEVFSWYLSSLGKNDV